MADSIQKHLQSYLFKKKLRGTAVLPLPLLVFIQSNEKFFLKPTNGIGRELTKNDVYFQLFFLSALSCVDTILFRTISN
ncbi:hypothetical protein IX84_14800 [Phaeodactylibacter xiamenensis]|uniref:Uncharacterized protein n=1 Tax=Phaeodactylibacter xiamenensis TaxID=1524460 RepID=A0A098S550_9BACT|nr:hypothetical protein IX84_14800 [Phaeodactylibacter xiamenensis]